MKRGWTYFFLIAAVGVLAVWALAGRSSSKASASLPEVPAGSYADISVETLSALLKAEDRPFVLINVHIPYAGEIPGTDLKIPYNQIAAFQDKLPQDKNAPIVVYCRSGAMSEYAARTLVELGYTRVYNVSGGMNAWQRAGYPLSFSGR